MKLSDITPKGWIYIGITVLLIILIIYYFKNKDNVTTTTTATTPASAIVSATSPNKNDSFPLSYGARGNNVKMWQTYLNTFGAGLTIDGIWGPKTEAASLQYTKFNNITEEYFRAMIKY